MRDVPHNPTVDAHLRQRYSAIEPRGVPKMTGKLYNETVGKRGFWLTLIGINMVWFAGD